MLPWKSPITWARWQWQVVCGKDFDEVFERALFFEMACRIIVQSGMNYTVLGSREVEDLREHLLGRK